ncbi:MAG: hypothetical protein QXP36_05040 [Conexivisphaerales archaeon]
MDITGIALDGGFPTMIAVPNPEQIQKQILELISKRGKKANSKSEKYALAFNKSLRKCNMNARDNVLFENKTLT